ncbi:hypothetical protein BDP27DRAFT_1344927 [Rhodocollybia butyracea]|uniref:Uncharacterized protein n=1 Tax=Rhodocollybia butyracea TaxID=206335 RepID=A0A9P5P7P8_9AGAR|nr:hypothetical protein BDP27DRAFT_1344927 [Rhodocollybia butyracea]
MLNPLCPQLLPLISGLGLNQGSEHSLIWARVKAKKLENMRTNSRGQRNIFEAYFVIHPVDIGSS